MTSRYLGTNQNPGTTSAYFTPGATPGGAAKPTGAEGAFPAGGTGIQSAYFGVGAQPAVGNQSASFAVGAVGGGSTMSAVGGVPPASGGQPTMTAVGGLPMTGVGSSTMTAVGAVTPAHGSGHSTMTAVGGPVAGGGQSTMTAVEGAPMTGQSTMTAVEEAPMTGQSTMTVVGGAPMPEGRYTMTTVSGVLAGGQSTMTTVGAPMTVQSTSRMNLFKWFVAFVKWLFCHNQEDQDSSETEDRERAGIDQKCRKCANGVPIRNYHWCEACAQPERNRHQQAVQRFLGARNFLIVYVDASCYDQPQMSNAIAGCFLNATELNFAYKLLDNNMSWRFSADWDQAKNHTQDIRANLMEIVAVGEALIRIRNSPYNGQSVVVYTDNQFLIDGVSVCRAGQVLNQNWHYRDSIGNLWELCDNYMKEHQVPVWLERCQAHIGIWGNEMADRRAREAH